MALDLMNPPNSSNFQNPNLLTGECYNLKLTQSLKRLSTEVGDENTKSAQFLQEFYELMQARVDPPLESIWVYAALSFRSRYDPKDEPLDRISAAKQLFQLISSCSSSCDSSKSVALLAPVLYEVYKVVVVLFGKDLASKREKKAVKEVKSMVEVILGYINVCSSTEGKSNGSNLLAPFSDLVRIWAGSDLGVESFLPLVSSEVCGRVGEEGCDVGYLAGVVIVESFLLKLCLNLRSGISISKEDLEKELKTWAVGSITGFGNFYFFG